jgi:hypothetical protein
MSSSLPLPIASKNARRSPQIKTTLMLSQTLKGLLSHHSKNPPEAALVHIHKKPPKWTESLIRLMLSELKQPGKERHHYNKAERVIKNNLI